MQQLVNSFPNNLRTDVEEVIKILPLNNVIHLANGLEHRIEALIHEDEHSILFQEELLKIPIRVYFDEPNPEIEKRLTIKQQTILNCIFLRHHNGFVRQRRLEKLIEKTDPFVVPFTFQLLGEYVTEILEILDKHINKMTINHYLDFIKQNPKYWQRTKSRMISYWNVYYRQKSPQLKNYIGEKIVTRLRSQLSTLKIIS